MGKQTKGWTPPDEDVLTDDVSAFPTQEPTGWKPPAEDVLSEPVKKKELGAPSPSSTASPEPGKPSEPSSPPSTPTKYKNDPSVGKWTNLYRELVQAYNTPVTAEQKAKEKPDIFQESVTRAKIEAEKAGILGPLEGKPTEEKIKRVAQLQKEAAQHKPSKELQAVGEAKTTKEAVSAFFKDPAKIVLEQTAESLTSMALYGATRMGVGAAIGSTIPVVGTSGGLAVGMADTSLGLEFSADFMESLQEAGVDTSDPQSMKAAFENDEIISAARNHAWKKSIPIALFDLVSGGIAGKIVSKPAKSLIGKAGQGAVELAVQSLTDMTGEGVSQVVAGDKLQPGSILMEGVSGLATAPVEITAGALGHNKSPKEVVQEQTAQVDPTDEAGLDAKAEAIQDKVAAQEPAIAAGNIDAKPPAPQGQPPIPVPPYAQTPEATPPVQGEPPVPETKTEEEVQTQGDQKVEEDINQPKTLYGDQPRTEPEPTSSVAGQLPTTAKEATIPVRDTGGEGEATEVATEPPATQETPPTVSPIEEQGKPSQPSEDAKQAAREQVEALVQSGDLKRDGGKITVLTEKGGKELRRIVDENKIKIKDAVQEPIAESVDVREQTGDGSAVAEGNAQPEAPQESEGEKVSESQSAQNVTPQDVHAAAEAAGVDYNTKEFKKESKNVTGKEHLDDMTPDELGEMIRYIEATAESAPPKTGSVALDQTPAEEKQVSGIKKALVPEAKVEGTPVEKRTMAGMLASAKADVASGAVNPKAIVDEIATGNARALQPYEVAGLVYYKTQLDNKADQLNNALVDAIKNKDVATISNLQAQVDAINQEINNYHTMAVKTAYEQSLAFSMRKMLLDSEYNLASQVAAYKAVNNGVIKPEVENRFKELDKELKAANAQIAKLEEEKAKGQSEEALLAARQALQKQREQRKAVAQSRKEKINDFFNSLKAKPDSKRFNSITQVVGEAVYNGAIDAIRLAVLAGSDAATAIQAGVDYINEHYRGNDFNEQEFRDVVTPGVEKLVPPTKEAPKITMSEDDKLIIPHSIIRDLVENQGITKIEELVEAIKELISEEFPDLTDREVRDAITRYGETRKMSQDDINKQIREMKRMGKLISALEDVQNKKRPLRSGLQRDKLSDEERRLQREIKEGMKNLPVDEEEQAKSWKTALDAVKARLKNQIADIQEQITTGRKTSKKKGIEYDEEANDLKEQRDYLKDILEKMEGKQVMSDEQRVRNAVAAVERSIENFENRLATKDTTPTQRGKTPETPELKALRERRKKLRDDYDQMEKDLGVADKKKLAAAKKAVARSTENLENRIKTRDFETKKKTPVKEDAELTKLKLQREKIKQEFDLAKEKARLANRPWNEKAYDAFIDIWNVPKSLQATIDMSAPFRQGIILSVSHPLAGAKAFKEMFWQAWSEKRAQEWMLALKDSDLYPVIQQSKLYVSEPNARLTAKEEQFISNFAKKIPIFGEGFKVGKFKVPGFGLIAKSERAYSGFLNKLRVDVFTNGMDRLREQGITPENNPEAYKAWADFINNASGRGNLGKLELAAPVLNGLFFSPRYLASRFNLLNPVKYAKMPPAVRKMALKSMFAYVGFISLFLGLIASSSDDWEVEWDTRSSDFGKLKFGNTRFDFLAGFSQVIRFITQMTVAQRKNTTTGEIVELNGKKFPFQNRMTVLSNFFRSKLAPVPGSLWNIWSGKNMVGEEVTPQGELTRGIVPLYLQDLNQILEEEGPTGVMMTAIPAFFGIGVQSYKPKDKKKHGIGLTKRPEKNLITPLKPLGIGQTKRDVEE